MIELSTEENKWRDLDSIKNLMTLYQSQTITHISSTFSLILYTSLEIQSQYVSVPLTETVLSCVDTLTP